MKKVSKNLVMKSLFIIFLMTYTMNVFSQDIEKYDYAEIIVVQKVSKKISEVKQIYLNSSTDESLNKSKIASINNNSDLIKFMNDNNWEFVERLGSQPSNSGPIWISYIFRKKK